MKDNFFFNGRRVRNFFALLGYSVGFKFFLLGFILVCLGFVGILFRRFREEVLVFGEFCVVYGRNRSWGLFGRNGCVGVM